MLRRPGLYENRMDMLSASFKTLW
ncbi:hypothetical protein V3C99_002538, partial [Haemonchus contortus]